MLGVLRRAVLKPATASLGEVSSMCLLERMQFCQECTDTVFPLRPFAFLEHSVISYKRPSIITSLAAASRYEALLEKPGCVALPRENSRVQVPTNFPCHHHTPCALVRPLGADSRSEHASTPSVAAAARHSCFAARHQWCLQSKILPASRILHRCVRRLCGGETCAR